jgi:hypothetical protein
MQGIHTNKKSSKVKHSQHSQTHATNNSSREQWFDQVINGDHALVKLKRVSNKGVKCL